MASARIEARKLKGFQDYEPAVMAERWRVMDAVRDVATEAGFHPVGTPAMEYAEVLLGEGGETDKQVFKFEDNGGRMVALRYDLTVPFARFVAEHTELHMPFERFQIGDVWRAEKPQKGRYREFCQCDFDIIGVDSFAADLDVITCILKTLHKLNVGGFTMTLGHRVVLNGLLKKYVPSVLETPNGESEALIAIDKLDKIGMDGVTNALAALPGASADAASALMKVLVTKKDGSTDLDVLATTLAGNAEALDALEKLKSLMKISNSRGTGKVVIDMSIARGLAYYTGVVFETKLDDLPGFGSISSGGRYNNLADRFTNRHLPGVGGSIGLDRLVAGITELQKESEVKRNGLYLAFTSDAVLGFAMSLAEAFRARGLTVDLAVSQAKLGKQFAQADKLKRAVVLVVGEDEAATSTVTLKNLATGEQVEKVSLDKAFAVLEGWGIKA